MRIIGRAFLIHNQLFEGMARITQSTSTGQLPPNFVGDSDQTTDIILARQVFQPLTVLAVAARV